MNRPEQTTAVAEPEVCITRVFDAPRELVFKAWTDPDQLTRWYAPHGCQVRFERIDVRPGGEFLSCIIIPGGHECWCTGVYREIEKPARIVYTLAIADRHGNRLDAVQAGMDPEWPAETELTVTFTDENGKTRLTLHQTVRESLAKRTGAHPSWLQMLDRLATELAVGQASGDPASS